MNELDGMTFRDYPRGEREATESTLKRVAWSPAANGLLRFEGPTKFPVRWETKLLWALLGLLALSGGWLYSVLESAGRAPSLW